MGTLYRLHGVLEEIFRSKICLFRNVFTVFASADLKNHTENGWTAFFDTFSREDVFKNPFSHVAP